MFFIALVSYALAVALEFTGTAFKKDKLLQEERSLPATEFQRKLRALFKKYDL